MEGEAPEIAKKQKNRKDKPWDNDPTLDKFIIQPFLKGGPFS